MKFCVKCGMQLDDNTKFCTRCGYKFEDRVNNDVRPNPTPTPRQTAPVQNQNDVGEQLKNLSGSVMGAVNTFLDEKNTKKLDEKNTARIRLAGIVASVLLIISNYVGAISIGIKDSISIDISAYSLFGLVSQLRSYLLSYANSSSYTSSTVSESLSQINSIPTFLPLLVVVLSVVTVVLFYLKKRKATWVAGVVTGIAGLFLYATVNGMVDKVGAVLKMTDTLSKAGGLYLILLASLLLIGVVAVDVLASKDIIHLPE